MSQTCSNRKLKKRACQLSKTSSAVEAKWTSFSVPGENRGNGLFVYWIIDRRALEGYPVRCPAHPLEPNIESKTYNLHERCQQLKIKKHILEGKEADSLLIWNRRNGIDRILGCYENISHVTEIPDEKYSKRCAFKAENAFVLMDDEGIPMNKFAIRVENPPRNLGRWIRLTDKDTTSQIIRKIKEKVNERKGLCADDYLQLLSRRK